MKTGATRIIFPTVSMSMRIFALQSQVDMMGPRPSILNYLSKQEVLSHGALN